MNSNPTLGGNAEQIFFANCSAGKTILGGGVTVFGASGGRWFVDTSGPSSDTQWAVGLTNISGNTISATEIDITAICGIVQ